MAILSPDNFISLFSPTALCAPSIWAVVSFSETPTVPLGARKNTERMVGYRSTNLSAKIAPKPGLIFSAKASNCAHVSGARKPIGSVRGVAILSTHAAVAFGGLLLKFASVRT
jgi:hypothetical protein